MNDRKHGKCLLNCSSEYLEYSAGFTQFTIDKIQDHLYVVVKLFAQFPQQCFHMENENRYNMYNVQHMYMNMHNHLDKILHAAIS